MSQPLPTKVRQWTERLERFQRSQVTLTQFCRDEGVSMPSFYQWRKRLITSPGSKAAPDRLLANKAALEQPLVTNADARPVRITIESAGIVIHCDCDRLQLIHTVFSWANRERQSGFQQLIVRS